MRLVATLRGSALIVLIALLCAGCAHNSTVAKPYDPFEDANRSVYDFNQGVDRYVLGPVASGYSAVTPGFFRQGVDNFFNNASYPNVIVNDLLQGKLGQGLADTGRFLINTTVGVLGLFDVAQYVGLKSNDEDLGQTLAVWGANSGAYLELPGLGPNYVRDTADLPIAYATNVLTYTVQSSVAWPLTVLYVINKRAMLDDVVRLREEAALDPYVFTRTAYTQLRTQLIHDGAPPLDDLYDEELFEEFEGLDDFDQPAATDEPAAESEGDGKAAADEATAAE